MLESSLEGGKIDYRKIHYIVLPLAFFITHRQKDDCRCRIFYDDDGIVAVGRVP